MQRGGHGGQQRGELEGGGGEDEGQQLGVQAGECLCTGRESVVALVLGVTRVCARLDHAQSLVL